MKLDRRTLLVGAGAGAGLLIAYAAWPRGASPSLRPRADDALLGTAIAIRRDGRVTVAVPQVETGQGIWTGLAQIAADELGAAWETVAVAPALLPSEWANNLAEREGWIEGLSSIRRWRLDEGILRITAGSSSIRAFGEPMRRLAAAARVLLTEEAADRWSVSAAECTTSGGTVRHEGKTLPFAQLADGAATRRLPSKAPLRDAPGGLVGQSLPRLDTLPKANGTLRYAGDVRLPGMLFASLRLSGGGPVKVDTAPPTGVRFERGEHWLAAVAADWWTAEQALETAVVHSFGPVGGDDAAVSAALDEAMTRGEVDALFETGSVDRAFGDLRPLVADYSAAAALHADLEPPSATARLDNGLMEVWAATQAPELALRDAATAAGLSANDVLLYPMPVGGQGGRALEADLAPIAAQLTKRLGKPVQVTLSRTEQVRSDAVRAPLKARLMARSLPDGSIAALRMRVAGGDGTRAAMQRLFGSSAGGFRNAALPGVPYTIPNLRLEAVAADLPIRLGYHRAELLPVFHFFIENFFDELAHIGGRDPLSSRIALLSGNPRLAKCLLRATALGGWDGGGPGSTLGLSALTAFGSHIAVVASAIMGPGGVPQVSRLVAVVDCGRTINPLLVQQQVEGGMIASLAQASAQPPSFRHGRVLGPLGPQAPRLANMPEILVEVLPSAATSGGVNGLGAAAAPAAVGNALAAATGRRFRALPFTAMA